MLLHPFTSSGRVWDDLVPLLSDYHQVHTPTAIGHRGGSEPQRRPATIADLYDDAERWLDEHGLDRPHLFPGGVGKTWQPGDFTQLINDVTSKVFEVYPDSTVIYPGHGDDTVLGAERPHLEEWRERGW